MEIKGKRKDQRNQNEFFEKINKFDNPLAKKFVCVSR